jgi:hypothetical protein
MDSIAPVCCLTAEITATGVHPPRPRAVRGIRVTRETPTARVARREALFGYTLLLDGWDVEPLDATAVVSDGEVRVVAGFDLLAERAAMFGARSRPWDTRAWDEALGLARPALEAYAEQTLRPVLLARERRARVNLLRAARHVQSIIDESPEERRAEAAARGRSALDAVRAYEQSIVSLVPRIALTLHTVEARACWRLFADGVAVTLAAGSRADGVTYTDPCASCGAQGERWSVCVRCVAPRCVRCARRCGRCGHRGCVRCAAGGRCARCGLMEGPTP